MLDKVITETSGAIDALRQLTMARASNGQATDGEIYLIMQICDGIDRIELEIEVLRIKQT